MASKGKSLEDYELIEMDSAEAIHTLRTPEEKDKAWKDTAASCFRNGGAYSKDFSGQSRKSTKSICSKKEIEAITGYVTNVEASVARGFFDEGCDANYEIKATGLKLKR